jgi:SOS-response transcriptional repressor LexA
VDKKKDTPKRSAPTSKAASRPATRQAFVDETDAMHDEALAEIKARGEDPQKILRDLDSMKAKLREQYLRPDKPNAVDPEGCLPDTNVDASAWTIDSAVYFEESVAAGFPSPCEAIQGRPAELSDLMQGINPAGMLLIKVSGTSMTGTSIEHGDTVLVDLKAVIRDGDLVLANLAGHGQVVKRLRISATGEAILESESPDFKPIVIADAADLRIHGKVVWRCGPLR